MFGRNHLGYARDRSITGVDVPFLIKSHEIGLHELTEASPAAVADSALHVAVAVNLEHLTIIAARDPWDAIGVEMNCANKVSHRQGFHERSCLGVYDDTILVTVANPDIPVSWIDPDAMD